MIKTLYKHFRFMALLVGMIFLFCGCITTSTRKAPEPNLPEASPANLEESETDSTTVEEQTPKPSYRFTDVPVPSKFKFDRNQSFTYEAGAFKAGLITYTGRAKLDTLIDFYKKEMPNYGWEILSSFEHKDVSLVFTKEGWNCSINISFSSLGGSKIKIQIGPVNTP